MSLSTEQKAGIVAQYGRGTHDTGSPEVQVALLSARIEGLTEPHQLEVSIDGERLQLFTVNPMRVVRLADGVPDDSPV